MGWMELSQWHDVDDIPILAFHFLHHPTPSAQMLVQTSSSAVVRSIVLPFVVTSMGGFHPRQTFTMDLDLI